MSKIAFVQNLAFEFLGVMYISGLLKDKGHEVEMFIGRDPSRLADEIKRYGADLVGFSCSTGNHYWCLTAAKSIKERGGGITIFGGPHATFFPEIINEPQVDIVCLGEAEGAVLELADKLKKKDELSAVANCWFKQGGKIIKNDVRAPIENLDALPFPDHDVYYKKYPFLNKSQKTFIAGRGCPFKCSYCFNESMYALYSGKGQYTRHRSVDNLLCEIKHVRDKYGMRTVAMADDTFILNTAWVSEFLGRYASEVGLPLLCLARADLLTEEVVRQLRKANCRRVFFGIESGSENLRNLILNKRLTDEQIIRAAGLLKKYGIRFRTYNMVGMPGETLEDAFKTVLINVKIKTDYPWCSILQPYPKTAISEYAREKGLLKGAYASNYFFKDSVLIIPNIRQMTNLQKLFYWLVKFPFLIPLAKKLIKLAPNPVFNLFFLVGYAHSYYKSERLTFKEVLRVGWHNVFSFLYS